MGLPPHTLSSLRKLPNLEQERNEGGLQGMPAIK